MRVKCPCCSGKFDVPHREVLAEAARLADKRKAASERPTMPRAAFQKELDRVFLSHADEPNGNILSPADAEGKRERAERLARRGVKP